ncbi:hypothetical protein C1646_677717, partial [Rhizophagus diaphanus]
CQVGQESYSKISLKEEINKSMHVSNDKQVKNQLSKGNANRKKKLLVNNLSKPAVRKRDQKPTTYLCELGAKSFKIVQTGKGKRKLVGYFEIWEAVRKVLDYHQVLSSEGIRLSWCQHSTPNLKKVPTTKDRSGGKKTDSSNAKSKKKDQSSSKAPNKSNQLKKPLGQNTKDSAKLDNSKKMAKGGNNLNKKVLAKILELLQKLV